MEDRFMRFSPNPIGRPASERQASKGDEKPRGFWISVEGPQQYGWANWCVDNRFGLDRMSYCYEVTLEKDARLLKLKDATEIDQFTQDYGIRFPGALGWRVYTIDWKRVARRYQGIIIAPYCWERRLETPWYYGWDCASGCIWDSDAVRDLTPISPQAIDHPLRLAELRKDAA